MAKYNFNDDSDDDGYLHAVDIDGPTKPPAGYRSDHMYYNQPIAAPAGPPDNDQLTVPGADDLPDAEPSRTSWRQWRSVKLPKRRTRKKTVHTGILGPGDMHYQVEDVPPWYLCIILGFQHYLIMFGATVSNPLVIAPFLCVAEHDALTKSHLIGTIFFVSGIVTLMQTTIGVRLPLVQGGNFTFVIPTIALLKLDAWACPNQDVTTANPCAQLTSVTPPYVNQTMQTANSTTEPIWMSRMREVQGAIMLASVFEVIIGFSGIMGFMLRFIGPLAIAPTITLAGLKLFDVAAEYAETQWWITLVTVVLIVAFSQYTKNINIPCFRYEKGRGCIKENVPIFRLFPVILAVSITWIICAILTATKVFPSDPNSWGYGASTNTKIDVLQSAPWFRIPYPGQWGTPTVSMAGVFGMLAGVLASMVESVGDYYACARMSGAQPPPMHAVNRGIGIEGLGCILAGAFGHGSSTTTYSENIGAIGITKVASRRVLQCGAVFMIFFGVFGKFGALFVTIPKPVIGGVFIVMFGMVAAVGISNLQFVDLNSSRNLFIIGFTLFFGLTLPKYLNDHKDVIKTGNQQVDQIILVLLSTNMFVGGLAGFILDNTIPGTDEERGLISWRKEISTPSRQETSAEDYADANRHTYDVPFITKYLKDLRWARYIPVLPTFDEHICMKRRSRRRDRRERASEDPVVRDTRV